jgi:hypothetical protein
VSGYVPLFESIATGTLYGRWPDIGLWPIVLALSDKHGHLDVTPHYLAGVTGLPVEEVVACMARFCAPDPYSRSKSENGARLRLIDEHRDWGWIVVNHAKYREKARLMGKDSARTESGQDAERKRKERGSVSPYPPVSPDFPLSDSDSNLNKSKNQRPSNTALRSELETEGRELGTRGPFEKESPEAYQAHLKAVKNAVPRGLLKQIEERS